MLHAYVAAGHEVEVFHFRFPHEEALPEPIARSLARHVDIELTGDRRLEHLSPLPPLAWQCRHAHPRVLSDGLSPFDVVQAETSNTWGVARSVAGRARIAVLHDDDATRLRTLAKTTSHPLRRAVYRASAVKFSRWQRKLVREADRIWFVSETERQHLAGSQSETRTAVVPNGAGDELWSVGPLCDERSADVLFVGPGFYEANSSGLAWFLDAVWPLVRKESPDAGVRVVGSGWERFGRHPQVSFAGWRDRLADEYAGARVVIAPLFAGGGTKLKVVEAMAAARPVVATPSGAEGLPTSEGLRVAEDPVVFAAEVARFVSDARAASDAGLANRRAVDGYRWSVVWSRAIQDLESLVGRRGG